MNIKDIAALAGVSASTVSKVLNRNDRDISEPTRKKVLRVVKEYQYVPYSKLRKHILTKNYLLGILLLEKSAISSTFVCAIEQAASKYGYSILLGQMEDHSKQIQIMESKAVDGILVVGDSDDCQEVVEEIRLKQIPCTMIRLSGSKTLNIASVECGEEELAYQSVCYLIEKGHSSIGCVISKDSAMDKGYQQALDQYKIGFHTNNVFRDDLRTLEGQNRLREWIKPNHTAIFCADAAHVLCLCSVLQERGIAIPDDISVIAGEDSEYFELLNPAITSVKSFTAQLAYQGVTQLIEQIESEVATMRCVTLPVSIQERGSVKAPSGYQGQKLVVVGSLNMDESVAVSHIPQGGETLIAKSVMLLPGGKGANQAVGAAKLGGKVYMIGCLGNDNAGKELYNNLLKNKVKTDGVEFETTVPTGKAYINIPVTEDGDSTVVVYPGANRFLSSKHIKKHAHLFDDAKYCLLSLEIPIETASYTVAMCKRKNIEIILKPSGADAISKELLEGVSYLIPNTKELYLLVPGEGTVEEKAERLYNIGVKNVIVTLGKDGCYLKNDRYARFFKAADFEAVDTTGGADAFISALAVYLSEDVPLVHAIGFATYSAGISVTRQGVQPAMPDRAALDMYQDDIITNFKE